VGRKGTIVTVYVMKVWRGSRGKAPLILKIYTLGGRDGDDLEGIGVSERIILKCISKE